MSDKVLLIDGLNFLHRARISFTGPKVEGPDYTIVFNCFRNLRALMENFSPSKVFFCLEGKNSFRKELYSEYKANRIIKTGSDQERSKENFDRQRDIVLDLLKNLPITGVFANTFEADDVIFTLAQNLKDEDVIIISNDGDLTQILQMGLANVRIYNSFKKDFVSSPDFHYLTYKCFGDKSDNVPRIASEKKAIEYATDPKKLLEFLSNEENRANYALNKQLVELRIIPEDQLQFVPFTVNYDLLRDEFAKMQFKTMVEDKYWERFVNTFKAIQAPKIPGWD